jgi:phosphoribosylformimino-5-aminoimidazole carboxamide ribotide isomerase
VRVYAAIDLLGNRCVRLLRGEFADATVYSGDPVATARTLVAGGAPALHVVDLDGARRGRACHADLIAAIVHAAGVPVQVGGGLRSFGDIEAVLTAGAERVVIGTAALRDSRWTAEAVRRFAPERIVVAVDVRGDQVFSSGWQEALADPLEHVLADLAESGVETLLVTDIDRDGTLEGPNLELYERLRPAPFRILSAGGIIRSADLRALAQLDLDGAVVGRAIYEGTLSLRELREVLDELRELSCS